MKPMRIFHVVHPTMSLCTMWYAWLLPRCLPAGMVWLRSRRACRSASRLSAAISLPPQDLRRKISSRVCRCARPQGCSSIVRMFGSGMWVAAVDSTTRAHSPTPLRNVMAWGRDNFATYTTMKQNNKRTEAKSGCKMYKQLCFSLKITLNSAEQLKMSCLWAFHLNRGNDLATVLISAICICLLSNNSFSSCKNTTIIRNYKDFLRLFTVKFL